MNYLYQHVPTFVFHPDELHMPCSIEYHLRNSALYDGNQLLFDVHTVSRSLIGDSAHIQDRRQQLGLTGVPDLNLKDAIWEMSEQRGQPVYGYLHRIPGADYLDLYYVLHYNNSSNQYVVIRVKRVDGTMLKMYCGGRWCEANDVQYSSQGRPLVYVALTSHVCFSSAGKIYCCDGCRERTGEGMVWTPRLEVFTDDTDWMRYVGRWGTGPQTVNLPQTNWFKNVPNESTTRLSCC